MSYQTLTEVWHHVLDFIIANQENFGGPQVFVHEEEVEVCWRTSGVLKNIPDGCESWRIYCDENYLVLSCRWQYKPKDA